MAAPRFSPAGRLLVALLAVYATVAVLAVWFRPSLRFAASRLPGYFKESIASPDHRSWKDEAAQLIHANRELDRATVLLERAWAVEPNASTQFLLGEVMRVQANPAEALAHYRASIDLDPGRAEPYLRSAELFHNAGDEAATARILDEGIAALERAVQLWVPVPDRTVRDVFNEKAREVHEELELGLAALRAAAAQPRNTDGAYKIRRRQ